MTKRASDGGGKAVLHGELVKVGISACLLGEAVRYDGRHKYEPFIATLAEQFSLVPTCPEVEIGLGVPRSPLHLADRDGETRLVTDDGADHTSDMLAFAARRIATLEHAGLCGYVFKSGSPSCGLGGIAVTGVTRDHGGLFASAVVRAIETLPVEEETALRDPAKLVLFIERVRAYHRNRSSR